MATGAVLLKGLYRMVVRNPPREYPPTCERRLPAAEILWQLLHYSGMYNMPPDEVIYNIQLKSLFVRPHNRKFSRLDERLYKRLKRKIKSYWTGARKYKKRHNAGKNIVEAEIVTGLQEKLQKHEVIWSGKSKIEQDRKTEEDEKK